MRSKGKTTPDQPDMFHQPVFPTRMVEKPIDGESWSYQLAMAMKRACLESGKDRHDIAASMAKALGQDDFSKGTLDAYISVSKTSHTISLIRFKAFVRATGCHWLWDYALADEGCTVLIGDEARLAEIALVEQQQAEIAARLKALKSTPVTIKRRRAQ